MPLRKVTSPSTEHRGGSVIDEGTAAGGSDRREPPGRRGQADQRGLRGRGRRRALVAGAAAVVVVALVLVAVILTRAPAGPVEPPGPAGPTAGSAGSQPSMPSRGGAGPGALAPPSPAAAFTGSVGVNVHWDFLDTPYGTRYEEVRDALVASGVRHVRGAETSRAADLARRGVATTVLVDREGSDPASIVAGLAPLAVSGAVDAVEGPNEGDVFWTKKDQTYRGEPFPAGVVAWQQDLWRAVHADERTADLTVIGPSLGGTYWGGGNPFAPGSLTEVADWANIHPYAAGNPYADRFSYGGIEEYYDDADFPSVALDRYPITLETYRPPFGDLPVAATEAGWSTWALGPSEAAQAAYVPRLFLECYRLGLARCYSYELVDELDDPSGTDREAHFGLLRHDLTPKPAYTALSTLMAAVGPGGAEGPDGPEGADRPGDGGDAAVADDALAAASLAVDPPDGYDADTVHHVAVARSDGSVVVALWQEVSRDDISGRDATPPAPVREVEQPAIDVRLDLAGLGPRAEEATVQVIEPDGRLGDAGATRSGSTWSFPVPDRVTLVTLPPR